MAAAARRRRRIAALAGLAAAITGAALWFVLTRPVTYDGTYEISAIKIRPVAEEEGSPGPPANGWRVVFGARWTGEKDRPNRTNPCRQTVLSAEGVAVNSEPFGLFIGKDHEPELYTPHLVETSEAEEGLPVEARITCDPIPAGTYEITDVDVVKGWSIFFDAAWEGGEPPPTSSCLVDVYDEKGRARQLLQSSTFDVALGRERSDVAAEVMVLAGDVRVPPRYAEIECEPSTA